MSHEIVSLQIGHFANFVGTHWWNLQDASFVYDPRGAEYEKEVNHDVMFREGQTLMGDVTFTPRLVSLDLKGSLNTLKQEGSLYDLPESADDVNWGCDITMHKEMSVTKNDFLRDLDREEAAHLGKPTADDEQKEDCDVDKDANEDLNAHQSEERVFGSTFYDLDESVHVWSDYLRVHLHPRSVSVIQQYQHHSDLEPFDMYMYGHNVYRDQATQRDIDDRIHYFIEECDQLQGFHLLCDIADGFGGLSCALLENLEDELGKSEVFSFGLTQSSYPNSSPIQDVYRTINMVMSIDKLCCHSSALVPLSLAQSYKRGSGPTHTSPHLTYKTGVMYHEAAILAAGLDTATLPYRLHTGGRYLSHLTQALTPAARKILALSGCLPLPVPMSESLASVLDKMRQARLLWSSYTPDCDSSTCDAQSVTIRGVTHRQQPGRAGAQDDADGPEELLAQYVLDQTNCTQNALCAVKQSCKTSAPFPNIFSPNISVDGCLCDSERPKNTGVHNVGMLASFQSTCSLKSTLEPLVAGARSVRLGRYHHLTQSGLEADEFAEVVTHLQDVQDNYSDVFTDMI